MGRRRKSKTFSTFEKHPIGTPLVILIILGVSLADQYTLEQPKFNTQELIALLVIMNICIFMLLGIHRAWKRTKKVKYWTFGQKSKFTIYLFVSLMMFAPNNIFGELLYISFFLGLIYYILRGILDWCKSIKIASNSSKLSNVNHVALEEIDRMDGRQFELFLSKLYDGLGYYSEVTPPIRLFRC